MRNRALAANRYRGASRPGRISGWLDAATILLLLATLLVCFFVPLIFLEPGSAYNPFPPPSPTPTTPVPTSTSTLTATPSPVPSETRQPSPTPTSEPPTATPTATTPVQNTAFLAPILPVIPTLTVTPDLTSPYPFTVTVDSPARMPSSLLLPGSDCNWMGVGGRVVDPGGAPIIGLQVQLHGTLHGRVKNEMSLSGSSSAFNYGYEIQIDQSPSTSNSSLWVQLFSQAGGELSDKVYFNTVDSCEENLVVINFRQVR